MLINIPGEIYVMDTNENKGNNLSSEDKRQLDNLSKEINERLEVFGKIVMKTLGRSTNNPLTEFSFVKSDKSLSVRCAEVVQGPEEEFTVGYYCDPPGICSTQPCG
jgi:hypothetical protein